MLRRLAFSFVIVVLAAMPASAFSTDRFAALADRQALAWRNIVVDLNVLAPYYLQPGVQPIWVDGTRPTLAAEQLFEALARAHEDGLTASDYLPLALTQLTGLTDETDALGFELAMSQAYMAFARDLHAGRTTPSVTDPEIVIARKDVDARAWLGMVVSSDVQTALAKLAPQHRQYYQLRQMLSGYRALAERGGWPLVPAGEVLKPGMRDPRVADMRRNLTARGYSGLNVADPTVYDDGLKTVVEHFQKRHGLDADGIAGPATFGAMNITAQERVRQIIINMERWRWLPVALGNRHVFVNQAGFEMMTFNDGKKVDTRRIIVGKPFHKTPIFSDEIRYAEFNPTWTVPTSIAGRSLLPKFQSDPSLVQRDGYSVYAGWSGDAPQLNATAIDWNSVSASRFPYRIVQQPGPENALGQVKFMFPNKFAIYLHDTPARQLFARTGRAFSSGCIRIVDPLQFAELLFGMDGNIDRSKITSIIDSAKTTRVNFKQRIPVHLAYFTAWIDDDGVPYFYDDVYERDLLVGRLLFGSI